MINKKYIEEIEVYNFWKYIKHTISYNDYKKKLMDAGYIIYRWDMESSFK